MIVLDRISRLRARYRENYVMPDECRIETQTRNVRRILYILPVLFVFGIVMTGATLMMPDWTTPRFRVALGYYSAYIAIGLIPVVTLLALKKANAKLSARNAVCYAAITAMQCLCLYQRTVSSYTTEGYLVWTISNLLVIAVTRLMLDNLDHVKAYWVQIGEKLAPVALHFGADDLVGTVTEETITHAAGATTEASAASGRPCRPISSRTSVALLATRGEVSCRSFGNDSSVVSQMIISGWYCSA